MGVDIKRSPFGHVSYALIATEEELESFIEKENITDDLSFLENAAQVHHFEYEDGSFLSLVLLNKRNSMSNADAIGLLVHESVHIWQKVCELMEEEKPSSEFEAYSVQNIFINLFEEWNKK